MTAKARGEAFVARAPGKLMLAGEYAVLRPQGGRALAVALPEGVEVTARPSPGGWELTREEDGLLWREATGAQSEAPPPEALRFVHAALQSSRRSSAIAQLAPLRLSTRQLGALGTGAQKPGVGGSASATVATCAVLAAAAGEACPPETLLERALCAHREAQGGRGSGYDVATIVYGGLVDYQRLGESEAKVERRRWPSISIVAGYSGESASTRALLVRVDAIASAHPDAFAAELAALGAPVDELSRALVDASPTAIAEAIDDCHARLAAWDRKHALGIVTPAIEALLVLARAVDVPCKIAGGGGGDSVVALHDDPQRLARLRERWQDAGFAAFDVTICPDGVGVARIAPPR